MVLVDTAGRMQDNAPLMTALAKLIAVNVPDLVLFVGEALVGNEAVDQLVRPPIKLIVLLEGGGGFRLNDLMQMTREKSRKCLKNVKCEVDLLRRTPERVRSRPLIVKKFSISFSQYNKMLYNLKKSKI